MSKKKTKHEHLEQRWEVVQSEDQADLWCIKTVDEFPWWIAEGCRYIPGDDDGRIALQHIVDLHNASLAASKSPKQ